MYTVYGKNRRASCEAGKLLISYILKVYNQITKNLASYILMQRNLYASVYVTGYVYRNYETGLFILHF